MLIRPLTIWILLLFAILSSQLQGQQQRPMEGLSVNQIVSALIAAERDSLKMATFFADWNRRSQPNHLSEIHRTKNIQAVYAVFREYFKLYNPKLVPEELNPAYLPFTGPKYLTIQPVISYRIFEDELFTDDESTRATDTIFNFRPPVDIDPAKILYQTREYKLAIDSFLGIVPSPQLRQMMLTRTEEEFKLFFQRSNTLEKFISIDYNISYVALRSGRIADSMVLNKSLTKAILTCSIPGGGTKVFKEKIQGRWKFMSSRVAWYN